MKPLTRVLSLLAVALAGCNLAAPGAANPRAAATPLPTLVPLPTAALTAATTVAVDGALALAEPAVAVSFETTGRVVAVLVQTGQRVKKGETLARLDDTALQDALAQAKEQLALVEARQAQSAAPAAARQSDIDSARASLSAAWAAYNDMKKRPTTSAIELALRAWNQARNQLWSAQITRDSVCALSTTSSTCKSNDASVGAAYEAERSAYQRYLDAQAAPSEQEVAQAWSNVASAEARLGQLTQPLTQTAEARRLAAAELDQARSAVDRASRNVARAILLSPCDCAVQDVAVAPGATAGASPAFTLARLDRLVFRSSNLSERDLGAVRAGADASLRLKPFDRTFKGKVSVILPQASGTQGNAAIFTVVIAVEMPDAASGVELLPGMTGQAEVAAR